MEVCMYVLTRAMVSRAVLLREKRKEPLEAQKRWSHRWYFAFGYHYGGPQNHWVRVSFFRSLFLRVIVPINVGLSRAVRCSRHLRSNKRGVSARHHRLFEIETMCFNTTPALPPNRSHPLKQDKLIVILTKKDQVTWYDLTTTR